MNSTARTHRSRHYRKCRASQRRKLARLWKKILSKSVLVASWPLPLGAEEMGIAGMVEHADGRTEIAWTDEVRSLH